MPSVRRAVQHYLASSTMSIQPEIRTVHPFASSACRNGSRFGPKHYGRIVETLHASPGRASVGERWCFVRWRSHDGLDHFAVFDPARNSRSGPRWKSKEQEAQSRWMSELSPATDGRYAVFLCIADPRFYSTSFTQWFGVIRSMTDRTLPGWMSGIGRSRGFGRGDLGAGAIGAWVSRPVQGIFESVVNAVCSVDR